jgi:invasion protein IalB
MAKELKQGNLSMFPGISLSRFGIRGLAAVAALATASVAAIAQDAPTTPPTAPAAPSAPAPATSEWQKVCTTDQASGNEVCGITNQLRAETGLPIASVTVQWAPATGQFGASVFVPITVILPPGVALTVDGEKKATAPYMICLPQSQRQTAGCIARTEVKEDFITAMKKGNELALVVMNAALNKPVPIKISLAGFSKVFDGPGLDPAAAEARSQQLSEALQKSAEEARQKLIEQQQKELQQ